MKRHWELEDLIEHFTLMPNEVTKVVIDYIAKQVQVTGDLFNNYEMNSRTYYNHKVQIRKYFQFREPTAEDANLVSKWLLNHVLYYDANTETLKEKVYNKFRELQVEPLTPERIERITKFVIFTYENQFFQDIFNKLSEKSISKMDTLINDLTACEDNKDDYNTENFIV